jgi:hypothetical protein
MISFKCVSASNELCETCVHHVGFYMIQYESYTYY